MTNQSLGKEVNNETDLCRGGNRRLQQSVKAATVCVDEQCRHEQCRQTTTMFVSGDVRCQRVVATPVDDNEQCQRTTTMSDNDDQTQRYRQRDTGTSQRLRL